MLIKNADYKDEAQVVSVANKYWIGKWTQNHM